MSTTNLPKLTIITNNLYSFGGGERLALQIASGLSDRFDVTLLNPVSKKDSATIDRKMLVKKFRAGEANIVDIESWGVRLSAFGTESFVVRIPKPVPFLRFASTIKNSDLVYQIGQNPLVLLYAITLSKLFGKKFVFGIHSFAPLKIAETRGGGLFASASRAAVMLVLGSIKYFHATTSYDFAMARKYFPNAQTGMVYNPAIGERRKLRNNTKEFVCLYVGRLDTGQKGIDLLSETIEKTLAKNKAIKFVIVGKGGDGEQLVKQLCKKYPRNVSWPGFLAGEQLDRAYENANLFLHTSRFSAFYLVLYEAESRGLPIVAFEGNNDIIKNAFQGAVVKRYDTSALASNILAYYSMWRSHGAYAKTKERIIRYAYVKFSREKIFDGLAKLFEKVLASD